MSLRALVIDKTDNVANLIGPGSKGETAVCRIEGQDGEASIELLEDIPSNHKFAFTDISKGDEIIKYGLVIGEATADIARGAYVHAHNIDSKRGRGDLAAAGGADTTTI